MSLLDENLEIKLTPQILQKVFGLEIITGTYHPKCGLPRHISAIYSRGYFNDAYIEVWYENTIYDGALWVYGGCELKSNMIHVEFKRNAIDEWTQREDICFSDLHFDEFAELINAVKSKNWDFLDMLFIHKPFTATL